LESRGWLEFKHFGIVDCFDFSFIGNYTCLLQFVFHKERDIDSFFSGRIK